MTKASGELDKESSFYGRERELRRLKELSQKKTASLVVIKGRRRIGKSRLAAELAKSLSKYTAMHFQGLPPSEKLNAQQEQLLQRWGYPYTEEAYRFHLTLTDDLTNVDIETAAVFREALDDCFAAALATPWQLDGLAVFRETEPGSPFELIARLPFLRGGRADHV